jgi:hypothetical protein
MSEIDQGNISSESGQPLGEAEGLKRRHFLKTITASVALIPFLGGRNANAQSAPSPGFLGSGTLLKVLNATGVRSGVLTNDPGTGPVADTRESFATNEAYADAGYWFFFYEANGLVVAARIFTTRNSGKRVTFTSVGQRSKNSIELISSMGTQVFDQSGSFILCRLLAANRADQLGQYTGPLQEWTGQQSSSYFVSTQQLIKVRPSTIDLVSKDLINNAIASSAQKLKLVTSKVRSL